MFFFFPIFIISGNKCCALAVVVVASQMMFATAQCSCTVDMVLPLGSLLTLGTFPLLGVCSSWHKQHARREHFFCHQVFGHHSQLGWVAVFLTVTQSLRPVGQIY